MLFVRRSLKALLVALTLPSLLLSIAIQASAQDLPGGILPDRPKTSKRRVRPPAKKPRPKPEPGVVAPEPQPEPELFVPSEAALDHYRRAGEAYDRNDLEKAVEEYEAAIELEGKYLDALIELGSVYYDLSDTPRALDTWERALFLDDSVPELHNNIANASYVRHDYERAVREYKKAIELRPEYYDAMFGLGNTLMALKRYDEAADWFQQAIDARGLPFPDARSNMAWAQLRAGKIAEAEVTARRAIEDWGDQRENSVKAWYALAAVMAEKPDLAEAASALRHAIEVCSGCPSDQTARMNYSLATILEANGQKGAAADALEEYLRLAPFVTNKTDVQKRILDLRQAAEREKTTR